MTACDRMLIAINVSASAFLLPSSVPALQSTMVSWLNTEYRRILGQFESDWRNASGVEAEDKVIDQVLAEITRERVRSEGDPINEPQKVSHKSFFKSADLLTTDIQKIQTWFGNHAGNKAKAKPK